MLPAKVFISYAHTDHELRKKLEEHLSPLKQIGKIDVWQDQKILPGSDWSDQIQSRLKDADVILLLVSSSFLDSRYCRDEEVQKALERHKEGTARVIPIILRPVDWKHPPLGELQALPKDSLAVTQWDNLDAALEDAAQGIRKAVDELQSTQRMSIEDKRQTDNSTNWSDIHSDADTEYIIGVDIDRLHVTLLLTDRHANPIDGKSFDSLNINYDGAADVCLTRVADELQTLLERNRVTWEQIAGIGLAIPGPLDRDLQRVQSSSQQARSASQMPGWEGKNIPEDLRLKLHHKLKKEIPILLDNDANMGALGESRYGQGRGVKHLVYIKIGIGIGAGLIINGELYRGHTNAAGELGHTVVEENGAPCACGKHGCLEAMAAVPAIVKDACEGISLRSSNPNTSQTPALARRTGKVDIEEVVWAAHNGDEASQTALKRAGERIGIALGGTVINLLNPSMILLDGYVVQETDLLRESVRRSAEKYSLFATWTGVKIRACRRKNWIALGAVANVIDHISGGS